MARVPQSDVSATRAAIARGQADILAAKVTPHPDVARLLGCAPQLDAHPPADRAVVWSDSARAAFTACVHGLTRHDSSAAITFASAVDSTARDLGRVARGVTGLLPHTYEKAVPATSAVLSFELVAWTKAGEVVAILHLFEAPRDINLEGLLWS